MSGLPNTGSFLIGTDLSLTITNNASGTNILLDGHRTNFTQKSDDTVLKSETIDNGGLVDLRVIPNGWSGTIEVDRGSGDFDALFANGEAQFYAGANQQFFSMTVKTPNKRTGGSDTFIFQNVVFHGYEPGSYQKTSITKATVNWTAQQRTAS